MRNLLRMYRKKSELTIDDISQLLDMQDSSSLSRCEKGMKKPTLEIQFAYCLLFRVANEKLFELERQETLRKIRNNIDPLIENLKKREKTRRTQARINFLITLKAQLNEKI